MSDFVSFTLDGLTKEQAEFLSGASATISGYVTKSRYENGKCIIEDIHVSEIVIHPKKKE